MSKLPLRSSRAQSLPLARKDQLIIKNLHDEVLVYDLKRNKAHCLNQPAAAIWHLCDGRNSPSEIATKLGQQTERKVDEDFVWLALDQLDRDYLLTQRLAWSSTESRVSRREAIRRIGLGAAIVLPIVASITAPTPAQAATCLARNQPCTTSAQCCSGICRGNNLCA
jgi:Coenzyme PQQ synthesis protein D (PqqD)